MAEPLVDWHIGRMPLVITCPHDGRAEPLAFRSGQTTRLAA